MILTRWNRIVFPVTEQSCFFFIFVSWLTHLSVKFKVLGVFFQFSCCLWLSHLYLLFRCRISIVLFLAFFLSRRLSLSTMQSNPRSASKGGSFICVFPFFPLSHNKKRDMTDLWGSAVTYQDCIWRGLKHVLSCLGATHLCTIYCPTWEQGLNLRLVSLCSTTQCLPSSKWWCNVNHLCYNMVECCQVLLWQEESRYGTSD